MTLAPEVIQIPRSIVRGAAPRLNTRIPPIASKFDGPGKLAALSQGKLRKESLSHAPNLLRCLGHTGIYRKCVQAAQDNARKHINAFYGEDEATEEHTLTRQPSPPAKDESIRSQITKAVKVMVRRRYTGTSGPTEQMAPPPPALAHDFPRRITVALRGREYASRLVRGRKDWGHSGQLIQASVGE